MMLMIIFMIIKKISGLSIVIIFVLWILKLNRWLIFWWLVLVFSVFVFEVFMSLVFDSVWLMELVKLVVLFWRFLDILNIFWLSGVIISVVIGMVIKIMSVIF